MAIRDDEGAGAGSHEGENLNEEREGERRISPPLFFLRLTFHRDGECAIIEIHH